MSVTIKSNVKATANLKYAVRDNLLKQFATTSANVDGVFLISLDDVNCYVKQSAPALDDTSINIAKTSESAAYNISRSTGSVSFNETTRSLDYSNLTIGLSGFQTPENWIANEFNGQNKYFIMTAYVFIPNPADWHAKSGGLVDFAGTITSANSAVQTEVLAALAFIHHPTEANEYQIWGRFSKSSDASGAYSNVTYSINSNDATFPFGQFAQISLVRNSAGTWLYIISSKGVVKVKWSGTDNTGKDVVVAGDKLTFGRGGAYSAALTNKYKLSRCFIINLNKNPVSDIDAFLKADFDRQVARGFIA